jgi:hypothetical protein
MESGDERMLFLFRSRFGIGDLQEVDTHALPAFSDLFGGENVRMTLLPVGKRRFVFLQCESMDGFGGPDGRGQKEKRQ